MVRKPTNDEQPYQLEFAKMLSKGEACWGCGNIKERNKPCPECDPEFYVKEERHD